MAASPRAKTDKSRSVPADRASADAHSHAIFRQVNEEIRRVAASFGVAEELALVCECARGDCFARVLIASADYEAVRRFPTRFLIKPGHLGGDERIVAETPGYAVIERVARSAAAATVDLCEPSAGEEARRPRQRRRCAERR